MKKRFKIILYLSVFLLPIYLIRLNYGLIRTNVLEVLILLAFVLWLANEKEKKKKSGIFFKNYKITVPFILIFLSFLVSILINGNYLIGLGIVKSWLIFPFLAFFLIGISFNEKEKVNIFKAFYFSAFFVASEAILSFLIGYKTYDGRALGIFNSPNYLAMYVAPAILFGGLILRKKDYFISVSIMIAAFFLTKSYSAWLSVFIAFILLLNIKNKKWKQILFFSLIITLAFLFIEGKTNKFADISNQRGSTSSRIMIWNSAAKIIEQNWIFGIGPGNFQEEYLNYQAFFPPYLEWAAPHPHNVFLAFWLYGGIISFAAFILMIFFWYLDFIKREKDILSIITFCIITYFLIHGFTDTTFFKNDLAIIFWFSFIGLIKIPANRDLEAHNQT